MKGIWRTNPAGDRVWPDWFVFKVAGITRIYFPLMAYDTTLGKFVPNVDELTPEYRKGVNSQGFEYATYNCWNWSNAYSDPKVMAQDANDVMDSVGGVSAHMYNDETHNANRILSLLKAHRAIRAKGPISWALEGMQGGWFSKSLVNYINSDPNCVVVPEAFEGDMTPINVQQVRTNLINAGIVAPRVKVFLDGSKSRPSTWDGCILSEENLKV